MKRKKPVQDIRTKIPSLDLLFNTDFPTHGNPFPNGICVVWYRNRGWVPVREAKIKLQRSNLGKTQILQNGKIIGEQG